MFFRIIQEILLNTIKHAKATKLLIEITNDNGYLILKTADNGIGYDSIRVLDNKNKKGYGLLSILSRVKYLNGEFEHDQSKEPGTRYIISFPANDKADSE